MDQSRYWIQKETGANNNNCLNPHVLSSFGDSWEEQAFAEDAAGPLGGCIWPPRSYTCSFCRREFRSAQALGGHMNVHRRDRARLKQVSSPNSNQLHESSTSLDTSSGLLKNPNNEISNPNFDLDHHHHHHHALFSSSSPRASSALSILRPAAFTCSFGQEQQKSSAPILSWSKFEPRKRFSIADFGNQEKSNRAQLLESNSVVSNKNTHPIEVHSLNSLVRKTRERPGNDDDGDDDSFVFKRRRVDDDDDAPRFLFPKNGVLVNDKDAKKVVPLEHSPNSTLENLDLELRLGDRP